jgi:hypothetical protein
MGVFKIKSRYLGTCTYLVSNVMSSLQVTHADPPEYVRSFPGPLCIVKHRRPKLVMASSRVRIRLCGRHPQLILHSSSWFQSLVDSAHCNLLRASERVFRTNAKVCREFLVYFVALGKTHVLESQAMPP